MSDGMATMTHRTTFALDDATALRIDSLAKLWKVSKAEVVRRAVSQAEVETAKANPIALLQKLHESGEGLSPKTAKSYLAEIREDRHQWRGQ